MPTLKTVALAAGLALGLHLATSFPGAAKKNASDPISLAALRASLAGQAAVILDVRSDEVYRRGHIPGALSLPYARFPAAYAKLERRLEAEKDALIVVYCNGVECGASHEVQKLLGARGYSHVVVFPEGWAGWQAAGLPVELPAGAGSRLRPIGQTKP